MATAQLGLSEKQQDMRKTGVGASEVAAICGLHPTKKPIDVWLSKQPDAEPWEGNSFTEFGTRIERVLFEAYSDRHPAIRVYTPGTIRHPKHSFALATPDRVSAPPGQGRPAREDWIEYLEGKTVFFARGEYGESADEVPYRHIAQVQWGMECCDMEKATLVALVSGDYREYPLVRDREVAGLLLQSVERFWVDYVLKGVPPPIDGSEGWKGYLKKMHPEVKSPPIPATPEMEQIVARLAAAKKATQEAQAAEESLKQQVVSLIGDAEGIEGLCTYRLQKGSTFTVTKEASRVLRLAKEK